MNILIVEDEQKMQELYKDFLELHTRENTITITKDGIEAFMKCSLEKFDVILLDYKLPRMNGLDLLTAIRSGGLNETTSIIMASGALPDIETSPPSMANTYFLKKPMDFKKLDHLLQTFALATP
ncbi:MAG: response regulator [Bacteriovorax sp.]|jgi:DNA-binding response OmpR family regulator